MKKKTIVFGWSLLLLTAPLHAGWMKVAAGALFGALVHSAQVTSVHACSSSSQASTVGLAMIPSNAYSTHICESVVTDRVFLAREMSYHQLCNSYAAGLAGAKSGEEFADHGCVNGYDSSKNLVLERVDNSSGLFSGLVCRMKGVWNHTIPYYMGLTTRLKHCGPQSNFGFLYSQASSSECG